MYDQLDALAPSLLADFVLFPDTDEDRAAAMTPPGPNLLSHFARRGGWIGAREEHGEDAANALFAVLNRWQAARSQSERDGAIAEYANLVWAFYNAAVEHLEK